MPWQRRSLGWTPLPTSVRWSHETTRPWVRDAATPGGAGYERMPRLQSNLVHVLLATDAQWLVDDVVAALGGPETSFTVCRNGRDVTAVVTARTPDIAVLDLQSGSMGGMAVAMNLRLDESSGALPHIPVLMLLDRRADVFLAKRSGADAWLVKPLDALTIQRAVHAVLHPPAELTDDAADAADGGDDADSAAEEAVPAG